MKLLLTVGGTREPIDAVRYIGNRSSGRMGAAVARAGLDAGHSVTAVVGQIQAAVPAGVDVIQIETTRQMHDAVLAAWPGHDAIIMAAAVADFRPKVMHEGKLRRAGGLTLELEPTEDILAAVGANKRAEQLVVGFSLDEDTVAARERAKAKMLRKKCDLLVFNPIATMESADVGATLFFRDGRIETLPPSDKGTFARTLLARLD